jgi:DedD protein
MAARRRGSRAGTFLVLCGTLGVLTATFVAGVWTGHNWPVLFGQAKAPAAEASGPRHGGVAERPKPDTPPALTFYDELKAPLTAPPPPPPRTRSATMPPPRLRGDAEKRESPGAASPEAVVAEPAAPTTDPASRFTVQVAAYNARTPAEALRATLASTGHDARVVEGVTGGAVRYRVQVGTFPTREAAQAAAARLSAERALPTFVTTR